MLPRYSLANLSKIWSDESKFSNWLKIEVWALEAMQTFAGIGNASSLIEKCKKVNLQQASSKIQELEKTTKHDVVAFLQFLEQEIGQEDCRFLHFGLTSSDIVDTSFAMQLRDSVSLIIEEQIKFIEVLDEKAEKYKNLICLGRTHGQAAEPMSFGVKWAGFAANARRDLARLKTARETISWGKLSGACGGFAHLPCEVEAYVMESAGLHCEPVSSQVVPRDRHCEFFTTLAIVGASLERVCCEIRHLSRSDVGEVGEYFAEDQKGSSAMPHKQNPILSENVTGLCRVLKGYAVTSMENVALWHERDISHSSSERIIAPDCTSVLHFAINRMSDVCKNLIVFEDRVTSNLKNAGDLFYSQKILLMLIRTDCPRQEAYSHVQIAAKKSKETGEPFLDLILKDSYVESKLSRNEILKECSLDCFMENVEVLLERSKIQ